MIIMDNGNVLAMLQDLFKERAVIYFDFTALKKLLN